MFGLRASPVRFAKTHPSSFQSCRAATLSAACCFQCSFRIAVSSDGRPIVRFPARDFVGAVRGRGCPHDLLLAASPDRQLSGLLEGALQKAEMTAVQTALPTPGASEALTVCEARGKLVAVVSNNYAGAVVDYLNHHGLTTGISHIEGRDSVDPELMKPSPHLLERTVQALDVRANSCIFIGDQPTDIEAGRAAGTRTIGYANKPGKAVVLSEAGADAVIDSMTRFVGAIA
jgi:beta-phosphoglucomutase-like phosphatase (HAD superfamily)